MIKFRCIKVMTKKVDWGKFQKSFKPVGGRTMKERFADLQEAQAIETQNEDFVKSIAPIAGQIFLKKMLNKEPIKVIRPFFYSGEEFFPSTGFEIIQKSISLGKTLTFKNFEKSLEQFWFEDESGNEIGIYKSEQLNLLFNTDIYNEALALLKQRSK